MIRALVLFLCVLLSVASARAAEAPSDGRPILIGQSYRIHSAVLGGERRLNVYLPEQYGDAKQSFPVLYLLDGGEQEDFHHITGLAQINAAYGFGQEVIVVGMEGADRRHDLTSPSSVASDLKRAPTSGGAAAYRRFLVEEVKPWVAAHYRISGRSGLIGESLAGLFTLETLLKAPASFDEYIAVSPSLWWNGGALSREAASDLKSHDFVGKRVFLAFDEPAPPADVAARERAEQNALQAALETVRPKGLSFTVERPGETHGSIYHPAAMKAFRLLYPPSPTSGPETATVTPQAAWYAAYFRDSRLIEIAQERRLNLYCEGTGSPTVVLESGLGDGASSWAPVQHEIARTTRVCSYDRAGHGRSPPGAMPRDTRAEVEDLERLLEKASLPAPYVLVGHSMGAYNVRLYASRHPGQVAGLVLVDGSVEHQSQRFSEIIPNWNEVASRNVPLMKKCADPQRSGAVADACTGSPPQGYPAEFTDRYSESQSARHFATTLSERESFDALDSDELVVERHSFGRLPLIVLTAGSGMDGLPGDHAAEIGKLWSRMHDEVAGLSTIGVNRTVDGAHHYIHGDRPEAVIAAVNEVVQAARHEPITRR